MNPDGDYARDEMIELAMQLAWLRPLTPYPGWIFASAEKDPRLPFRLRAEVAKAIAAQTGPAIIPFDWHYGTRVNLNLRDDSGRVVYLGGCIEPNEMMMLDRVLRPGMTLVDVGANSGLFTLLGAGKVGPGGLVWAFEPSKREFEKLSANLALSAVKNVKTSSLGLLDREGTATLSIADAEHSGQNTLGNGFVWDVQLDSKLTIDITTLDSLTSQIGRRIDVMKIDVEGSELGVLRGAAGVLKRDRPTLLMELLPAALKLCGADAGQLLSFLSALDYKTFYYDPATGRPTAGPVPPSENILALPAEKDLGGIL